jgi:SOUL heme-binding protein
VIRVCLAWALLGVGGVAMAVERPSYRVELESKPFEVRDYPASIVAVVAVDGSRSEAVNAGFRILAAYIFGANQRSDKIAMTAPVTQRPGETIAMTAPVQQSAVAGRWEVRFTMPAAYTLESLPRPRDERIRLQPVPAHRMAVVSFSGFWSDANLTSHESSLADFIRARHLTPVAPAVFAYYDPPWIPWFLRTNEVQIEVAPPP